MSFSERLEDTVGVMTIVVVVTNGWGNKLAFFFPSTPSSPSFLSFSLFFFFLTRHAAVLYGFGSVGRKPQCLTCRTVEERGKCGNRKCRRELTDGLEGVMGCGGGWLDDRYHIISSSISLLCFNLLLLSSSCAG